MNADMDTGRETPAGSPRISFSHHLSSAGDHCPYSSESNSDFHFCNIIETQTETSCADEIFSNGFLLPLHQKPQASKKDDDEASKVKSQSRPFWRIRRSSSLHCENSEKRGSSWSFHSLPRSSSTGSKQTKKKTQSSVHFYEFPLSSSSQKPPLRPSHGNGAVRINPVLNVPPPSCIHIPMGNTNLFGLGSLFKTEMARVQIRSMSRVLDGVKEMTLRMTFILSMRSGFSALGRTGMWWAREEV
nr:Membrane-associated kinase regulator [Ipomoea batatas]